MIESYKEFKDNELIELFAKTYAMNLKDVKNIKIVEVTETYKVVGEYFENYI